MSWSRTPNEKEGGSFPKGLFWGPEVDVEILDGDVQNLTLIPV